jgi:hypothetical protein
MRNYWDKKPYLSNLPLKSSIPSTVNDETKKEVRKYFRNIKNILT